MAKQSSSKRKGDDLEIAVKAIEEAILREAPGYEQGVFKIEGNRIIDSDGVHHEIDIFVTAAISPGYESVFIFECKNWDSKVGKNEIIIFDEKIHVTNAQRGFFVAKEFTKDAIAQASKTNRIQLLTANYFEPLSRVIFPQFHLVNEISVNIQAIISGFNQSGEEKTIDLNNMIFNKSGEPISANTLINELGNKAKNSKFSQTPTQTFPEGLHTIPFGEDFKYSPGELLLDGKSIKSIQISGTAEIEIAIGSLLSAYDIESRGRMLKVGVTNRGIDIKIDFIQLKQNNSRG